MGLRGYSSSSSELLLSSFRRLKISPGGGTLSRLTFNALGMAYLFGFLFWCAEPMRSLTIVIGFVCSGSGCLERLSLFSSPSSCPLIGSYCGSSGAPICMVLSFSARSRGWSSACLLLVSPAVPWPPSASFSLVVLEVLVWMEVKIPSKLTSKGKNNTNSLSRWLCIRGKIKHLEVFVSLFLFSFHFYLNIIIKK